ncbi:MAG: neutral/alkaline non-lysosomal ceramidase N-terminal domain-containing protein [Acidobacteriota bacterium]
MKTTRLLSFVLILCVPILLSGQGHVQAADKSSLTAGLARVVITPEAPIWMAGYASRNHPSEGKVHDLYAKALAVQDGGGRRLVLVTSDLIGFPRSIADSIAQRVERRFGLKRNELLLTSTHTHTGPVLADSLTGSYSLDAEQTLAVEKYTAQLQDKIVGVVGEALTALAPARLSFGRGAAQFAVNRREPTPTGVKLGVNRSGPVDPQVPVLRIDAEDGTLRGVLFGYACHNTTLPGEFYQLCGDYSGFAQAALETSHPGAVALFVMGCGADANPFPRGSLADAEANGDELARSVEAVLAGSIKPIQGPLILPYARFNIPLAKAPSREQFQARLSDKDRFVRLHAERMIASLDRDGKLPTHYPYTAQVVRFGGDLTLVALAGEVVVDYALRLQRELGAERLWVVAYANDVPAYIPTARMLEEGGYEPDRSMIYYGLPGPFSPEVEEIIIRRVRRMVGSRQRAVGSRQGTTQGHR